MAVDRRRAGRTAGFGLRLAATVVLTVTAVGVAQYELADRALTDRVLDHELDGHRADAQVLTSLHRPASTEPMAEVESLLGHMTSRPAITSVVLFTPGGTPPLRGSVDTGAHGGRAAPPPSGSPEASAAPPSMPMPVPDGRDGIPAHVQQVADRVRASGAADAVRLTDPGQVVIAVPAELSTGRHVLVVTRSDRALEAQVGSVRRVLLTTLALGALLFLPLFYVVGGRGLALRHRRAVTESTRDHLTGLGNHRAFSEDLSAAVARGSAPGAPVCLALLDLDGFKGANDRRGHRHGDDVLVAVSAVLAQHGAGRAHRVGGDEFALLLPLALDRAHDVCEQVRQEVSSQGLGVTTSVGVAALARGGTATGLRDAADAALYSAKRGGGDRVVSAYGALEPVRS